jgi:hypothetical protein
VRITTGKGMGGFATRRFRAGELIIADQPLVSWHQDSNISKAANLGNLCAAIDGLSRKDQEAFFSMSQDMVVHGLVKSVLGIWLTNAYAAGPVGSLITAIFTNVCRLNHACSPNTARYWNEALGKQEVHAAREIAVGDELTLSYIGGEGATREQRRDYLQQHFGFLCACSLCSLTGASSQVVSVVGDAQDLMLFVPAAVNSTPLPTHLT